MGWHRPIGQKENLQATELSQLKEELRRVSERLESREIELAEALEQQAATSEILRVIASSPTNINRCLTPWSRVELHGGKICVASKRDGQRLLVHSADMGSTLTLEGRGR